LLTGAVVVADTGSVVLRVPWFDVAPPDALLTGAVVFLVL